MSVCGNETNREQVCSCTSMTRGWQAISSEKNTLVKVTLTSAVCSPFNYSRYRSEGDCWAPKHRAPNVRMYILCLNTVLQYQSMTVTKYVALSKGHLMHTTGVCTTGMAQWLHTTEDTCLSSGGAEMSRSWAQATLMCRSKGMQNIPRVQHMYI